MSVTRTFTVTVVSTGSGNKYFVDGVQTPTLELVEGATFRFDQSDSSNSTHPLRFATAADASGGTEYTTNVTTNGTPGSSGAYTQIEVASSAPTLYYYCTNHSGMGGQANTPNVDFWGAGTWSTNLWGISEAFTVGWGAKSWDDGEWNELSDETISLSGLSATISVGEIITFPEQGWGRDTWNFETWGESSLTVDITAPDAMISNLSVGSGFGNGSYGQEQGWGQFVVNPADVVGLTSLSSTASVGSPTIIGNVSFSLTGVSATVSVGSLDPTQEIVGLTGQAITSGVGSISPADSIGVTGFSLTSNIGELNITSNPSVIPTGLSITSSVGLITPADVIGLTGVSVTANVGTIVPADVMGLTGVSATASVAAFGTSSGFGIQAYQAIDTGSNTSYTDVAA